jgi:FKBP-type peptidyl-prolyl cis-trans isomerase SlyD
MAGRVEAGTVVTLSYDLLGSGGELLDGPDSTVAYLHGGYGGIFPRVEEALEGHGPGHEVKLSLEPEEAFGDYEPELLRVEPREAFPDVLQVGMRFEGVPGEGATDDLRVYTVTDITDDRVVVDGNHPLAGERLWFRCTIREVRQASQEELRHGHAHGEHAPESEEG